MLKNSECNLQHLLSLIYFKKNKHLGVIRAHCYTAVALLNQTLTNIHIF